MSDSITCDKCGATYQPGERIKVYEDKGAIGVACRRCAILVNQEAIRKLLESAKGGER